MNKLCLENQLCFKLYALSRKFTNIYRPVLEKLDITYPQYLVMLVLWEAKNISVKDLGCRLYLDSGTLTPLLKRLEQKQLLRRQRDPLDERSVIISLTPEGKEMQLKAKRIPEHIGTCLALSNDEYQQLKKQMDALLEHLSVETE